MCVQLDLPSPRTLNIQHELCSAVPSGVDGPQAIGPRVETAGIGDSQGVVSYDDALWDAVGGQCFHLEARGRVGDYNEAVLGRPAFGEC